MTRRQRTTLLALTVLLLVVCGYAAERHIIATPQIAKLLPQIATAEQISLPSVTSRVANPLLRLMSANQDGTSARLRIDCEHSVDCLPFYVTLRFRSESDACSFIASVRVPPHRVLGKSVVLVRRGSLASLEVGNRDVRLHLQVRCLESGSQGEVIRARDEVTRRVYQAVVINRDQLRARP